MKITVIKTVKKRVVLDVEFPYYFLHDLELEDGDNLIYGKIEKDRTVTIKKVDNYFGHCSYEFVIHDEKNENHFSYINQEEYKSNAQEFEAIKNEMIAKIKEG